MGRAASPPAGVTRPRISMGLLHSSVAGTAVMEGIVTFHAVEEETSLLPKPANKAVGRRGARTLRNHRSGGRALAVLLGRCGSRRALLIWRGGHIQRGNRLTLGHRVRHEDTDGRRQTGNAKTARSRLFCLCFHG